jgi:hypothetical protein
MKFPCVIMLLKVHGGIELSDDFIVSILFECQHISQVLGHEGFNNSIKDGIMLVLHVSPIYPLRVCHSFAPVSDHSLIEVLLKKSVKYVIIGIPSKCTSIDLPLFPHRLDLALIANLLPPSRVLRHPER